MRAHTVSGVHSETPAGDSKNTRPWEPTGPGSRPATERTSVLRPRTELDSCPMTPRHQVLRGQARDLPSSVVTGGHAQPRAHAGARCLARTGADRRLLNPGEPRGEGGPATCRFGNLIPKQSTTHRAPGTPRTKALPTRTRRGREAATHLQGQQASAQPQLHPGRHQQGGERGGSPAHRARGPGRLGVHPGSPGSESHLSGDRAWTDRRRRPCADRPTPHQHDSPPCC